MRASSPSREIRRARLAVAVTFLVHAAIFATWAPRIPSIKQALDLDTGSLGIALGGMSVGLLIGTRLTGRMEKRGRTGLAMRIIVPLQAVALLGPAFATDLLTLTIALAVLGLLGGMLDVAMNAHAVAVERLYGRPIMSGFHGLWSLGSMVGSAAAALVARMSVDVHVHFAVAGFVCAAASAPVLAWLLRPERESAITGHHVDTPHSARPPVGLAIVVVMAVMGFGSFLGEGAIADWSAVFLNEDRGASVGFAALGLSVFSGAMTASRLIADRVGARLGPVLVARAGAALGVLGYVVFLLVPSPGLALVGFAIAGFGIGPAVPVVFSAAGNTRTASRASVLGPVVSAGYLGSVLGPVVIGAVGHQVGLTWALAIPLGFVVLIFFTAGLLGSAAGGEIEANVTAGVGASAGAAPDAGVGPSSRSEP